MVPKFIAKNPLMGAAVLFIALTIAYIVVFFYRTTIYVNYLKSCEAKKGSEGFCHIKKFPLEMPTEFYEPLLTIARQEGVRIEIPRKRQKAIRCQTLAVKLPQVIDWYKSLESVASEIVGETVTITPLTESNSLSLVVYEREGDYIDWHFDTNHYNGRYFTMLIPVSKEPTCGNYQYKDAEEKVKDVTLERGEAVLFEGDRVFHRGKELCKDQVRVILSCTFTTSQVISGPEQVLQTAKNIGIFGSL